MNNLSNNETPFARFIGYQENLPGEAPIPLYNVFGGRLDKSTVCRETLEQEGIGVPICGQQ